MAASSRKFDGTKWKEYNFCDVKLKLRATPSRLSLVCPDVQEYFLNFSMLPFGEKGALLDGCKYFLLDQSDMNWLSDNCFSEKRHAELLCSLDCFTKLRKNKKIYLRKISTMRCLSSECEDSARVFLEEVLEAIPILLKQQKSIIDRVDAFLKAHRTALKTTVIDSCGRMWHNVELVSTTISLEELEQTLEFFDIDKTLITIVPDPYFKFAEREMLVNAGTPILGIPNPTSYRTLHSSQAVFHIFQCVVCSIDWSKDYCNIHHNCMQSFKNKIIEEMRRFEKMLDREYVLFDYVDEKISELREHCNYTKQMNHHTPLQTISHLKNDEKLENVDTEIGKSIFGDENGPVWLERLQMLQGVMDEFFIDDDDELKHLVASATHFRIPVLDGMGIDKVPTEKAYKTFESQPKDDEKNRKPSEDIPMSDKVEIAENSAHCDKEDSEEWSIRCHCGMDHSSGLTIECTECKAYQHVACMGLTHSTDTTNYKCEQCQPRRLPSTTLEAIPIQKKMLQKSDKNGNTIGYCNECIRYKGVIKAMENELNDVRMQLKTAQNSLKSLEKKGKKSDELEKKLKDTERKMKGVEKELEKTKRNETAIKETMKTKLKNKDEQLVELQKNLKALEFCASENLELQSKSEELEDSNEILLETIGQLTLKLNQTEDRLKMYSSEIQSSTVSSEDVSTEGTLLELQKIKDDFEKNKLMNDAKKMVEKLTTVTTEPLILQLGEYEIIQLQGTINIYLETIEMNIQKIQKTNDVTDLFPLPKFPSISRKFLDEYSKAMRPPPETGFSPELVCYICHEDFKNGQKLKKCPQCKKATHDVCFRKWIDQKKECGYCRTNLRILED